MEPSSVLLTQAGPGSIYLPGCQMQLLAHPESLMRQVGTFGDPGRDPRGWTVTVAYGAIVPDTNLGVKAADDAKEACWFDVGGLPRLAFDHKLVVREAFKVLAAKVAGGYCSGPCARSEAINTSMNSLGISTSSAGGG